MKPQFWHDRWQTGQIGFHRSAVDANLMRHWGDLTLAKPADGLKACPVLVPLCGKSVDMLWLREAGHSVVGVELSVIAAEAFYMENGIAARRRVLGASGAGADFDRYESPGLDLLRGDFFALTPALLGPVAAVYDRAALISWADHLRARYVEQLTRLLAPGAEMLLVTVEYPPHQMSGPPFAVSRTEVESLYARDYTIVPLSQRDILADEARLRAKGLTSLFEMSYRLTRGADD